MERMSISLENELLEQLEEAARKEKRSRSSMAAMLIERALSCQADDAPRPQRDPQARSLARQPSR